THGTVEGAIPVGWTVNDRASMALAPGTTNAGTLNLPGFSTVSDTGKFTNSGTIDDQAGFQGAALSVADLVNTGVIEVTGTGAGNSTSSLNFNYDNPTTAGIIDNSGTISLAAGQPMTVGPQNCKTGEDLIEEAGSTIQAAGTFTMQCGNVDIKGGTVTADGPIT